MNTLYYKYKIKRFGVVFSLKCDITPKKLTLVIVKFFNVIIFPYNVNEIQCLVNSRI